MQDSITQAVNNSVDDYISVIPAPISEASVSQVPELPGKKVVNELSSKVSVFPIEFSAAVLQVPRKGALREELPPLLPQP